MTFDNLLLERDAVAVLTINRPKVLNALNHQTLGELRRALLSLQEDAAVRVVIITGAGDRGFVAGADINELAALGPAAMRERALLGQSVFQLVERLGKPFVARRCVSFFSISVCRTPGSDRDGPPAIGCGARCRSLTARRDCSRLAKSRAAVPC